MRSCRRKTDTSLQSVPEVRLGYRHFPSKTALHCGSAFFTLPPPSLFWSFGGQAHFLQSFMFAVVAIAGFQEKVKEGDTLYIPLQDAETDHKVTFNDVLMVVNDSGDMTLGAPFVKGASVEVRVVKHGRDPKIRVVKFRHRKRYTRTKGHKQDHTVVEVTKITA